MKILVHAVMCGWGSTNDGNTGRKYIKNYENVSKIIGNNTGLFKICNCLPAGGNIDKNVHSAIWVLRTCESTLRMNQSFDLHYLGHKLM